MSFERKVWRDYPNTTTPITAEDLNRIEEGIDSVDESSKKFKLLTSTDVLYELSPGRYSAASTTGFDFDELGYPEPTRGLLFVQEWTYNNTNRTLTYYASNGNAYVRAVSTTSTGSWARMNEREVQWLRDGEILQDLPPGKYAPSNGTVVTPENGYPSSSRGVLTIEPYSGNGANRILVYYDEVGGTYTQNINGNVPRPWVKVNGSTSETPTYPEVITPIDKGGDRLLSNTESNHNFLKTTQSGTWDPEDKTDKAVGTQSILVETDGNETQVDLRLDDFGPLNLDSGLFKIWIKVDSWDHFRYFRLYLGTNSGFDEYRWDVNYYQRYLEPGVWRQLTLPLHSQRYTFGEPDPTDIKFLRIETTDDGSGSFNYRIGPIYETPKSNIYPFGVASFSFDDGRINNYEVARPIMDKYGIPGTAYINAYTVGTNGIMTIEQLQEIQNNSGWEIGGHAFTPGFHSDIGQYTEEELMTNFQGFRDWQKENHLKGDTFAYPGGTYNNHAMQVVLRYFTAARAIHSRWDSLPPNHLAAITPAVYIRHPESTPELIQEKLQEAMSHGLWLHLCFHNIDDDPQNHLQYPTSWFEEVCHMIYESKIPVRTVDQVIARY